MRQKLGPLQEARADGNAPVPYWCGPGKRQANRWKRAIYQGDLHLDAPCAYRAGMISRKKLA